MVADWPQGDHSSRKPGVPLAPGWQTGSVTDSGSRVADCSGEAGVPSAPGPHPMSASCTHFTYQQIMLKILQARNQQYLSSM